MMEVSDPEGTYIIRLYGPFAKEGSQPRMLAAIRPKDSDTYAAVYTSPNFGSWFVVSSPQSPWNPASMNFSQMAMGPMLSASMLNSSRFLNLPNRMEGVRDLRNRKYLGHVSFINIAQGDLDNACVLARFFSIDGRQHIFLQRIQSPIFNPYCFAFQMDDKVYRGYLLMIHKSGYI